jgi:hypothetical protein
MKFSNVKIFIIFNITKIFIILSIKNYWEIFIILLFKFVVLPSLFSSFHSFINKNFNKMIYTFLIFAIWNIKYKKIIFNFFYSLLFRWLNFCCFYGCFKLSIIWKMRKQNDVNVKNYDNMCIIDAKFQMMD